MRSTRSLLCLLTFAYFTLAFAGPLSGQTQPPPSYGEGFEPFLSMDGSKIDQFNLQSGFLNVRIPLVSYPQRGGLLHADFTINYKNTNYKSSYNSATRTYTWSLDPLSGIQIVSDIGPYWYKPSLNGYFGAVAEMDGTSHSLEIGTSYPAITVDGSGYSLSTPNSSLRQSCLNSPDIFVDTIIDNRGVQYSNNNSSGCSFSAQDPSGNRITGNFALLAPGTAQPIGLVSWTDTLGRVIPVPPASNNLYNQNSTTNYSGCTGSLPTVAAYSWTVPSLNGGSLTYKVCMASISINFPNCGGQGSHCQIFHGGGQRIQSIALPNGTAWTFQWDTWNGVGTSYAYGDLVGITLPAGGSITYKWPPHCPSCGPGPYVPFTRTTNANDGTGLQTTTYTISTHLYNATYTDTSTDPLSNDTVHTFTSLGSCDDNYYETLTQYYQGTGSSRTLLKTVQTDYDYTTVANPCTGTGPYDTQLINVLPIRYTTTWPNGQVTKTERDYLFDVTPPGGTIATSYGNVVARRDYDYGSGAPGPLLRQTLTTFQYQNSSAYKTNNLVALPATVTIDDGAGSQVAQTTYAYDENNGSPQGTLGNQTSVTQWLNGGTSPRSQTVFNSQGMPSKTIDPNGNQTVFTYDSTGAYVSQVQYPTTGTVQHIEKFSFDTNTGLLLSDTDQNNNTTTYKYNDPLARLTEIDRPTPDGGETTYTYVDTPGAVSVETKSQIDSSRWTDSFMLYDGLMRPIAQSRANGESVPWDRKDTCYDGLGRVSFISYSYQINGPTTAPNCSSGVGDSSSYDALSRVTQVKHSDGTSVLTSYTGRAAQEQDEGNGTRPVSRILQTDGLGRLTSVCEVSSLTLPVGSSPTPSACGLDISASGFLTTYGHDTLDNLTSVTQTGLNSRTFTYDSLSRLTTAANPESGTVTYVYDSDASCPTPNSFTGDLG